MHWEDRNADYYIQRLLRQLNLADFATEMQVERAYKKLAGDLIVRFTQSISFKKGTLRLRFLTAALRHEMSLRRESLRQKMNEELGADVVHNILVL